MKPLTFINKYGLSKAIKIVKGRGKNIDYMWYNYNFETESGMYDKISIDDLDKAVKAHILVESHGGLEAARQEAHKDCFAYDKELLAACYLVNQCS